MDAEDVAAMLSVYNDICARDVTLAFAVRSVNSVKASIHSSIKELQIVRRY